MTRLILALCASLALANASAPAWRNASLPFAVRVASLIGLMTLEEKVASLSAGAPALPRLGLPSFSYARECERGDSSGPSGTAFPSGAAMAATWSAALVQAVARATALEARSNANVHGGATSCFSPVVNLIHDARWGRTNEMLGGEDVVLGSALAAAWVTGLQSWRAPASPGEEYSAAMAVAKHLNAYSGPEGHGFTFGPFAKRFSFDVALPSTRADREFFLPMFRAAAAAGCENFMSSYSAVSGAFNQSNVPASASRALLTDVVRGEFKAPGFIISDAGAVAFIGHVEIGGVPFGHGYSADDAGSAIAAITAGLDIELTCCGAPAVFATLPASVAAGRLPESALDTALARSLRIRFQLGVLDADVPFAAWNAANVSTPAMLALAHETAEAAVVLLKNERATLPLSAAALAGRTIAVVGPNANDTWAQMGGYVNGHPPYITTPYASLVAALPQSQVLLDAACPDTSCEAYAPSAVALAASADVVIAVLGTSGYWHKGTNNESGACGCPAGNAYEAECCDRSDAALPGAQLPLLRALAALGKPLILILVSAGTLDAAYFANAPEVGAVLHAPFLGMASGDALARVLTGAANPSGRTTLTWFANLSAALPPLGDYSALYNSSTYRYADPAAISFPFGFGLSYGGPRGYADLSVLPAATTAVCDDVNVTVTVSNPGDVAGYEVVQVYGTLRDASVAPVPRRQLLAFDRVLLPPRSLTTVTLTVHAIARTVFLGADALEVVEPGAIDLFVGAASEPERAPGVRGVARIGGITTPLTQCPRRS